MAPAKGSKPEINPWGWAVSVKPEDVEFEHVLRAYRIIDYKACEDPRRNCRKNPFCYWGLGEKKWVQDAEDGSEDEDNGFREEGEFAGLQNLGATCYVNSLLQLWYHNPILRPAILRWQPIFGVQDPTSYQPEGPIAELQAMFARMKMSKKSKIDPTQFVKALKLDTGEQQDAQEFSKLFMEVILKMLTAGCADGAVRDAVASAFRGELQNEIECKRCKNKTQRQESFNELELGVRKNLNESLDELLKDELLTASEQYFCSVCDRKTDAMRRTQLLKLPPVLNLQLMRFVFDREILRKKKVTTTIQFPEMLDMTSRILDQSSENSEKEALVYQLSAVLIHNGPSASSGHYVAQIKDLRTGIWHKFNDENVDRVGKAKSQKLVLKEDEGSGSDTEKVKQKKGKATGNHSSQGAYMLVYTLERHIKQPEPDPETWSYLEQLIKSEDEVYEEEIRKSKNEKDYDNNLKEQRKHEIGILYPSLQLTKKSEKVKISEGDGDSDDFQPPKKKIARSEMNGVSQPLESKPAGSRNGSCPTNKTVKDVSPNNGDQNCKIISKIDPDADQSLSSPKNKPRVERFDKSWVSNQHFISTDWMQQWLDAVNPPPPIENKILACEHGKLTPPTPNSTGCSYKAIPRNFALELYDNYSVDGPRFEGTEAFCIVCVKTECQRLRKLHELENAHKLFVESNKRLDSILISTSKDKVAGTDRTDWGKGCFWLSKELLKNWKRTARSTIEQEYKSSADLMAEGDVETQEESDDSLMLSNSDLICPHNNLIPIETLRKIIPEVSWQIIAQYFPSAIAISVEEKRDCVECLNAKKGDSEIRSMNKEEAQKQKSKLLELYHNRNRPSITNIGNIYYAVSNDFLCRWKKFIKDPTRFDPVVDVNNKMLLCGHNKFMYPLNYLPDVILEVKPENTILCLVFPAEWETISDMFSVDTQIELKVISPDEVQYNPDVCAECATNWWAEAHRKKFNYTNQFIHIVRRDKSSPEEQQSDEDDDLFIKKPMNLPTKRDRRPHDPTGWMVPPWKSTLNSKEVSNSNFGFRRSERSRRQRGEKEKSYKVSSSTTLKELKVMILRDFNALPSDQHLFYLGHEIEDDKTSLTLGELQIAADSTLSLKIDTVTKHDEDPVPPSVENGFIGTLLMGNTSPSSPDVIEEEDVAKLAWSS